MRPMANEEHLSLLLEGVEAWNAWWSKEADRLGRFTPDLSGAKLAKLNLAGIDLRFVQLDGADLSGANLKGANLSGAWLYHAQLFLTDLSGAKLNSTSLRWAYLVGANLERASLVGADLIAADLGSAILRHADLSGATLFNAQLSDADLRGSLLDSCRVYGISAWNVKCDETTQQRGLVITRPEEPSITVDNLEIAQFLYLMLRAEKIRSAVEAITSKIVLILGRFTEERKPTLETLREVLRKRHDVVPVVFEFDRPATRDTHETLTMLARLARFVVADLTDPRSVPQELVSIVEQLPSVPVQPILRLGHEPWGMYDHLKRYPWVLPIQYYEEDEVGTAEFSERMFAAAESCVERQRP